MFRARNCIPIHQKSHLRESSGILESRFVNVIPIHKNRQFPGVPPGVPKAVYFACFCERRFFARSSFVQAQLISLNNSGAARDQDQSVQRLDLRSHKTSGGITKGQAETHRFTGVKIHGRKRAFTLENRLSRQFHGIFTVISRYFCVHHGPLCSHQNWCVKTCWGGTGFVESKRGNSRGFPGFPILVRGNHPESTRNPAGA